MKVRALLRLLRGAPRLPAPCCPLAHCANDGNAMARRFRRCDKRDIVYIAFIYYAGPMEALRGC